MKARRRDLTCVHQNADGTMKGQITLEFDLDHEDIVKISKEMGCEPHEVKSTDMITRFPELITYMWNKL